MVYFKRLLGKYKLDACTKKKYWHFLRNGKKLNILRGIKEWQQWHDRISVRQKKICTTENSKNFRKFRKISENFNLFGVDFVLLKGSFRLRGRRDRGEKFELLKHFNEFQLIHLKRGGPTILVRFSCSRSSVFQRSLANWNLNKQTAKSEQINKKTVL